ncbi:MAG: RnfH family protein [Wenzhouxiangella sp.]|jgi:putative ubiquitin-RnfH superfamily antitoxin RatB of RatAB toxin-antitoxin module|nr:RnfH family protein [Wenzhouxiangella sp.]
MGEWLQVEVAAALPDRQVVIPLSVPVGTTAGEAIASAAVTSRLPGFEIDQQRIGIFGRRCRPEHELTDGDRVELYRPLKADPKEIRRQLAELERAGKRSG